MKKNLRIVSAAAAALLAVAPIAAAAAPVNADAVQSANQLGTVPALNNGSNVNVTPKIVLTTSHGDSVKAALSVSFSATVDGTTATSNFTPNVSKIQLFKMGRGSREITKLSEIKENDAGTKYRVVMSEVGLNFGTKNANKTITLAMPKGDFFQLASNNSLTQSRSIKLDRNGTVRLHQVALTVTAKDLANVSGVYFVNKDLGNVVTAGNVTLNANAEGQANTAAVISAAEKAYTAYQVNLDNGATEGKVSFTNDLADVLKKANISVDNGGFFKAPHTLTFNLIAKSSVNDASAKLPVTVTFANVAAPTPTTETGVSKTIMHVAQYYDKNGAKTTLNGKSEVHAYDSVSVVATPVELKDASGKSLGRYYKIANQNAYIKVGNIDGTSRTLSHNAYLYKRTSSGRFVARTHRVHKKTRHVVVKKGTQETTYGSALYGKKYYRIGRNQYIKVANFR